MEYLVQQLIDIIALNMVPRGSCKSHNSLNAATRPPPATQLSISWPLIRFICAIYPKFIRFVPAKILNEFLRMYLALAPRGTSPNPVTEQVLPKVW